MKIELFFKSSLLLVTVLDFISQRPKLHSHLRFNVPNKLRDEDLLPYAEQIRQRLPQSEVCLHYSLKNKRNKGLNDATDKFIRFIDQAEDSGVSEVLLISGSGEKRTVNSVSCLQELAKRSFRLPSSLAISVAFNPYFSSEKEWEVENQRLLEKLATGYVSIIYLQFGSNIEMLRSSLAWVQLMQREGKIPASVKIYGSVFLPSKQLIARMKFRPWKGLLLTEDFLSTVELAESIVHEILKLYQQYGVDTIVETAFHTEKEANAMENLLGL